MSAAGLFELLGGAAQPPDGMPMWLRVAFYGAVLALCIAMSVIDIRHRIIPDRANVALAVLGLLSASFGGVTTVLAAAVQGGVSFGLFWLFRKLYAAMRGIQGLGLGDVKFLGAAGIWVGVGGIAPLILVACAAAIGYVLLARWRGERITARYALPFGPFLAVGLAVVLAAALGRTNIAYGAVE